MNMQENLTITLNIHINRANHQMKHHPPKAAPSTIAPRKQLTMKRQIDWDVKGVVFAVETIRPSCFSLPPYLKFCSWDMSQSGRAHQPSCLRKR